MKKEFETVHCRDCKHATDHVENSCYCQEKHMRVCACNRYGRFCKMYERK